MKPQIGASMPATYSTLTRPPFADETVVDAPPFGACRRVDIWDAWAYAQAEVEVAFRAWASALVEARRDHHLTYRAALEREERAASVLATVAQATIPATAHACARRR
jgi:hypothetical protein